MQGIAVWNVIMLWLVNVFYLFLVSTEAINCLNRAIEIYTDMVSLHLFFMFQLYVFIRR